MDHRTNMIVDNIDAVPAQQRHHFSQVPDLLEGEAREALGGNDRAFINPNRQKGLAAWAANKRAANRKRAKLAKANRRKHRA